MPVSNPEHQLKAGIFAHVEILPQARSDVIVVPREALRTEDGRTRLLVVRGGRAEAIPVEVGVVGEQQVEILAGAKLGERVIVGEAARMIAPGMPVRAGAEAEEPPT
jgi:multidrug efflux pump subunit AcrA (membrane-fusion protein)